MTVPVGGLRGRLIRESLYQMIYTALDDLTWFDTARLHEPVTFNSEEVKDFTSVPVNTAALADSDVIDSELELGSKLTEDSWRFYVDFFAQNDAVGLDFSRDVRDLLRGKMPSIGRGNPDFAVYDYQQATPPVLFYCQIEGVLLDRPEVTRQDIWKFWYSVRFDVIDTYADETG